MPGEKAEWGLDEEDVSFVCEALVSSKSAGSLQIWAGDSRSMQILTKEGSEIK
jgi:hypothetical protein